jgi:cytochrome P450
MKMHASKEYWGEDADEFKPERFEPENYKKVNPNAYIPFLRGPRNCIGFKYGMNSMKVSFAHFFRNYKLSTSLKLDQIELDFCVNTRVVQGYMVNIEKIDFKM